MRIGQKVVCIDDSIKPGKEAFVRNVYKQWIKEGETYTIRDIIDNDDIVTGILLKEVVNMPIYIHLIDDIQEPAFRMERFKELDEFEEEEELEEVVALDLNSDVFQNLKYPLLTPYIKKNAD
jgi:hypothetical protein